MGEVGKPISGKSLVSSSGLWCQLSTLPDLLGLFEIEGDGCSIFCLFRVIKGPPYKVCVEELSGSFVTELYYKHLFKLLFLYLNFENCKWFQRRMIECLEIKFNIYLLCNILR